MKYSSAVILAATGLAMAGPHRHQHRHQHAHQVKRIPSPVDFYVPGPTVVVYELNGKPIAESEVLQGIANGTLIWGEGGELESAAPAAPAPAPLPEVNAAQAYSPPAQEKPEEQPEQQPEQTPEPEDKPATGGDSAYQHNGDFPDYDESLSCDEFPEAFGAMPLPWLNLNNWAGIQDPKDKGDAGYNDIFTFIAGSFSTGGNYEGAYFSYACPEGYQSVQWPSKQGATKQSIGGLRCEGGKLKLTRGDVTKKLCDAGTDKVSIKMKNKMGDGVAVCRTNYPGPEDETIPTWVGGNAEARLACPDADDYYMWDGKGTSAQLYVNLKGMSVEEGCQWGDSSKIAGNWAPLNLGVGYSAGMGWISIFQNSPTTTEKLDFNIHIEGDNINGKCKYDAGKKKYCSGDSYDQCNDQGCTVAVKSGTAYYVFTS